jgi:hypothetical protein
MTVTAGKSYLITKGSMSYDGTGIQCRVQHLQL